MARKKKAEDPLASIDPVMEEAFSSSKEKKADKPENVKKKAPEVAAVQFPNLAGEGIGDKLDSEIFSNIPVKVSVELGRSEVSLKEVYELSDGSIIELDRLVGEPLDLVVNGQVIAQGEVVAIDNNYGLRITNVIARS